MKRINKFNIKYFTNYLIIIGLIILICIGCGGSSDNNDNSPITDNTTNTSTTNANIHGTWEGITNTQGFGKSNTVFSLIQDGGNITGGALQWTDASGTIYTENINGSINNLMLTISVIFSTEDENQIEFFYRGNVSGDTYSGDVDFFVNGINTGIGGTFTLTKNDDLTINPPAEQENPDNNDYCFYMFTLCKIDCGAWYDQGSSELTNCYWECNFKYQDCIYKGNWP